MKIVRIVLSGFRALAPVCLILSFLSCNEESVGRQPVDGDAPDPVSDVTWYPTPGGAVFRYTLPNDKDLLYVKAVFSRDEGVESESIASIYADSLVVEGFGDTQAKEVSLYAVDRSGNLSLPELVPDVIPLTPNIYGLGHSLELSTDFGGIRAKWMNESGEEFAIVVLQKDSASGEYVTLDRTYSTVRNGDFAVGNNVMEAVEGDFAVYAQDRWGHSTETKYYILTPLFLSEFDKSIFSAVSLPNDATVMGVLPMQNLWDGTREDIMAVQGGDMIMPKSLTFDLGVPGNVYRVQFLWRIDPDWEWRGGSPVHMKLYGCAEYDPTGAWNSWTEIYDYWSVKPSGLPKGQNTAEDLEKFNAGEMFDIDPLLPKMRYLRFSVYETWAAGDNFQIAEVTVYGDNR
ncbi:MAG: DUF4959 domain-containing protein [Bacteroidales bacterium]|nr:DUF4959 domain-containing protein [Bacteroidales bacterium]